MKTTGTEVLEFLIPQGGWIISGDEYEGITFLQCEPITKEEFEAGFAQVDTVKAQTVTQRQALLDKLGITEDEARLLLGGN
jgi:hypothetical protein